MKHVGHTENKDIVVSEIFNLIGTHGIPLENILSYCKDRNYIISWPHYVKEAMKDGAKFKNIQAKVFSAIEEIYGKEYFINFKIRWTLFFK